MDWTDIILVVEFMYWLQIEALGYILRYETEEYPYDDEM